MRTRHAILIAIALPIATSFGCGSNTGRQAVSGTVTVQGKPLETGTIRFHATTEPLGPMGGAQITNGRFAVPAEQGLEPGTYRVTISALVHRNEPNAPSAPGMPRKAHESIAAKYNDKSTLTVEVKAGDKNEFNFPLD